jgi:hypothetical protein
MPPDLELLGVHRWGEEVPTPILLSDRTACGDWTDHHRNGCLAINVRLAGKYRILHLTTDDALRLSDLLRAMASTNQATAPAPPWVRGGR